jgi:hypothetical protein
MKNNYIDFFKEQSMNKTWTTAQILGILVGLSGSDKLDKDDIEWAHKIIAEDDEPIPVTFVAGGVGGKGNLDEVIGPSKEDMTKSAVHTRPFPTTLPPTERVVSKSEQKRLKVQKKTKSKAKIEPPIRPGGRYVKDGEDGSKQIHPVVRLDWEESERGWGIRPDGYSLHLTKEDSEAFVKEYWDTMPDRGPNGEVPDEYSRPDDEPHIVSVDAKTLKKIKKSKNGIRYWH